MYALLGKTVFKIVNIAPGSMDVEYNSDQVPERTWAREGQGGASTGAKMGPGPRKYSASIEASAIFRPLKTKLFGASPIKKQAFWGFAH